MITLARMIQYIHMDAPGSGIHEVALRCGHILQVALHLSCQLISQNVASAEDVARVLDMTKGAPLIILHHVPTQEMLEVIQKVPFWYRELS